MATFEGKVILVTGGTGSFGGYFINYLLDKNFKEIRVFSRDELKQEEMRLQFQNPKIKFHIGDIRDHLLIEKIFKENNISTIYHLAAILSTKSEINSFLAHDITIRKIKHHLLNLSK